MRLSDLRNKQIRTLDGERLGRVHEVHCEHGRIVALRAGPGSFIERLTAKSKGRRIPWELVKRVEPAAIIVTVDPPKRGPARTRGGRNPRRAAKTKSRR